MLCSTCCFRHHLIPVCNFHPIFINPQCMQWLCVFIDTWLHFTVYEGCLEHKYTADFMWTVILKLSVVYVPFPGLVATSIVAVLQAADGKDKHLVFKCTILISLMSQQWANMNTLQVQASLYKTKGYCSYVNYRCRNIHSLVTIWGTTVYDHIWHLSVCFIPWNLCVSPYT